MLTWTLINYMLCLLLLFQHTWLLTEVLVCKTVVLVMSLVLTTNVSHVMDHALKVGHRPVLESVVTEVVW